MGYIKKIVENKIPGIYVLSLKIGSNLIQVTNCWHSHFCFAEWWPVCRSERAILIVVFVINVVLQGLL